MEKNAVRIVVSVVYQDSPPETAKMEEFASVLTRDLNLDPRQIQQMQATPTPSQVCPCCLIALSDLGDSGTMCCDHAL